MKSLLLLQYDLARNALIERSKVFILVIALKPSFVEAKTMDKI